MIEKRIQQHFFEAADLLYAAAESLSKPINDAASTLLGCITAGNKVMACSADLAASTAQQFTAAFLGRFERDRPALAALYLPAQGAAPLVKQVQALGQPGDVMLLFDSSGQSSAVLAALEAAHAKEMVAVALTGRSGGLLATALVETDVWIAVPHDRQARVHEVHALIVHALCDAIDLQLLGEQDSTHDEL
jgi:D-sedoheptulose 7-phosphate isomerase